MKNKSFRPESAIRRLFDVERLGRHSYDCGSRQHYWPLILGEILIATLGVSYKALAQTPGPEQGEAFASAQVMEQIAAIGREKDSWTPVQRKINSKLLLETKKRLRLPIAVGVPEMRSAIEVDAAGLTLVDIKADVSDGLLRRIQALGGQIINSFVPYNAIRALVPIAQLEVLAAEGAVKSIKPADKARYL